MWRNQDFCKSWSESVGEDGDKFQRYIVKPFIEFGIGEIEYWRREYNWHIQSHSFRTSFAEFEKAIHHRRHADNDITASISGVNVVDFGSGEGYLGRWLTKGSLNYLGLDFSEHLLDLARKKSEKDDNIHFKYFDMASADWNLVEETSKPFFDETRTTYAVICCALEALSREQTETFLQGLRTWLLKKVGSHVLVTTLNPWYFLGYRLFSDALQNGKLELFDFTVDDREWKGHLRPSHDYDRMFSNCGFQVLYHAAPPLRDSWSSVSADHFTGPFDTWILRPRKAGTRLALENHHPNHPALSELLDHSPDVTSPLAERVSYDPGELIESGGACCSRIYLVEKGAVLRVQAAAINRSAPGTAPSWKEALWQTSKQEFFPGEVIGEFEAGCNPISDRFKNPLIAGPEGATLIEMALASTLKLLDHTRPKLAKRMYETLRRRMSHYSWTWLDDITNRAEGTATSGSRLGGQGRRSKDALTNRDINYLARALLFSLTREAESPRGWANMVFADQKQFCKFLRLKSTNGDGIKFQRAILALVDVGIIDVMTWDIKRSDILGKAWFDIAQTSFEMIVSDVEFDVGNMKSRIFKGDEQCFATEFRDKLDGTRRLYSPKGLSLSAEEIINDLIRTSGCYINRSVVDNIKRWIENLSSMQRQFVSNATCSAFFVRSDSALRDILAMEDPAGFLSEQMEGNSDRGGGGTFDEILSKLMTETRQAEYIDAVLSHLISTWRCGENFASTAAKMNFN